MARSRIAPGAKSRSMYPLPGGNNVQALDRMVAFIGTNSPTMEAMVAWTREEFTSAYSEETVRNQIMMLRHAGLVDSRRSGLTLTAHGLSYWKQPSRQFLLALFCSRFDGMVEVLRIVRDGADKPSAVHARLTAESHLHWAGPTQSSLRVNWLTALGAGNPEPGDNLIAG